MTPREVSADKNEVIRLIGGFEDGALSYDERQDISRLIPKFQEWYDGVVGEKHVLRIFRDLRVRSQKDIRFDCLGRSWTHSSIFARAYFHEGSDKKSFVLAADVAVEDIDVNMTAAKHLLLDLGGQREEEIVLRPNANVIIRKINNKPVKIQGNSGPSEEHWEDGCKPRADNPPFNTDKVAIEYEAADKDDYRFFPRRIKKAVVIKSIYTPPKFRGQGAAKFALKKFISRMVSENTGILLDPYPFERDRFLSDAERESATAKLISLYGSVGFKTTESGLMYFLPEET